MRLARVVAMGAIFGLGCGPSITLDGETDDATGTRGGGDSGGDGALATSGSASTSISDAGDVTSDGADTGDVPTIPPDVGWGTTGEHCVEWPSDGCPLGVAPSSLVHGVTPLGPIPPEVSWAFFSGSPFCDNCVDAVRLGTILFVPDPSEVENLGGGQTPWNGIELQLFDFEGPLGEELPGMIVMRREGEEVSSSDVVFTIANLPEPAEVGEPFDPAAPAMISGSLSIVGAGWSVHGDFAAAYCPQLNGFAICE